MKEKKMKEIERKFLLNKVPDIEPVKQVKITQSYVSTHPEVRVRSYEVLSGTDKGHKDYMMTIKGSGDLCRDEIETYISEEFFHNVIAFVGRSPITKDYRKYEIDGYILEVSIVDPGTPAEFCYAEVEFDSLEEAINYKVPFDDFVDVTFDQSYKMRNYWLRTRTMV